MLLGSASLPTLRMLRLPEVSCSETQLSPRAREQRKHQPTRITRVLLWLVCAWGAFLRKLHLPFPMNNCPLASKTVNTALLLNGMRRERSGINLPNAKSIVIKSSHPSWIHSPVILEMIWFHGITELTKQSCKASVELPALLLSQSSEL